MVCWGCQVWEEEAGEVELEENWRIFVMARMMMMNLALQKLMKENKELWREVREMRKENTDDKREYFREV